MDMASLHHIIFLLLFLLSLTSARVLTNEDDERKQEYPISRHLNGSDRLRSFDFEAFFYICLEEHHRHRSLPTERRSLQRRTSLLKKSQTSHSRQQIAEILRQAYGQGWRPPIKHYMPATRFGRHQ